ncbi:ABC transporter ATP-binding protein [Liquorilactobacillus oeni]|uniref:ABC transporter ATP-binding protein n=1 Tax=Liquorilactobacillus oeni DSM 19972 TaxID=1423777 RepID=A0A0R1MC48_9LACO|nr:ABC transporter ATP-binding protein [Liquorilactobacillus oeni]KRL05417.1 ABC transporter ATP-binding protein [Liquorilactobacillus oeni DSM 19972]
MAQLEITDLNFTYSNQQALLFNNFNFSLKAGSFNLLVGPSGSGKSTLFKLMSGLYPQYGGQKTNGAVLLNGQDVSEVVPFERARHIALLFQNPSRQFAMQTVEEQLIFALENLRIPIQEIPRRITAVLTQLKLASFRKRKLLTLSGGEQQRVALATVLAMDSDIILLDEPFANVDNANRTALLHELKLLQQQQHKTIMISDHETTGYIDRADHVYQLKTPTSSLKELSLNILKAQPPKTFVHTDPAIIKRNDKLSWKKLSLAAGKKQLLVKNNFSLQEGTLGLLSGDNGVGKSTLFAALCHQKRYTGTVYYQGKASEKVRLRKWAKIVANVFQNSTDQFVKIHVNEEIQLSQKNSLHPEYWNPSRIKNATEKLQLLQLKEQVCYQLSGGQQKKLQVLSILIMSQPIMLLDEPFAGLDPQSLHEILLLIKETVTALHLSVLVISHQRIGVTSFMDYEVHLENKILQLTGDHNES